MHYAVLSYLEPGFVLWALAKILLCLYRIESWEDVHVKVWVFDGTKNRLNFHTKYALALAASDVKKSLTHQKMFHFLLTSIFLCGLLKVSICTPWRSKISGRWRLKIFFRNDWFLYFFADGSVFSCRQNTAVIFRTATPTTHLKNNRRNRTNYHPKFKNVFDTFSELWRAISNILWATDILTWKISCMHLQTAQ